MGSYKRLINEYSNYYKNLDSKFNNTFEYKIYLLESKNIEYKTEIKFNYKNKYHNINIFYKKSYPFEPPSSIFINNIEISKYYKKIISENQDLFMKDCICCKSLLCKSNWNVTLKINNLLDEIILVIDYIDLKEKRELLKKICNRYTNEDVDYLHKYLL